MDIDSSKWLKLRSGSDIRCQEDVLTDDITERIGYAFACMLAERLKTTPDRLAIAVGRDARPSGRRIKAALIRGITAADSDVIDTGACATPALFSQVVRPSAEHPAHGAVMVTGGDLPLTQNGFKFLTANGGLGEADVALMLRMASACEVPERLVARADLMDSYRTFLLAEAARLLKDDAMKPLLGLYVAIDDASLGGAFFADLMERLGAEIERVPDDQMDAEVPKLDADLGISFDEDSVRAWIYDPHGRSIDGNRLIALIAAMMLEQRPGVTFVTDSVTSTGLSTFIAEWGGVHYRFKRGYRNVISEAIRLNQEGIDCPLAIETTGHAAFRDNAFLDDGIYLALRVCCEALDRKREGRTVFDPLSDLSEPVETKALRLSILDEEEPGASCQELVEIILSYTLVNTQWRMAPDSREGVRITFNLDGGVNNAWFQLRMSVHDPVVALAAESDVPGGVRRVLTELYGLIKDTGLLDLAPLKDAISL